MKLLKSILIVIVVMIAIPLIVALFIPKTFTSESEIVINQPKEQVYDYVRHLKNMDEYAIWNLKDPDMKKDYEGEDGTVGFIAHWDSENNEVGKGNQKITNIVENEQVESEIRFDGWDDPMISTLLLEPAENENQTRVRWTSTGTMPYPFNIMSLFYDAEEDMNESLENLKNVLESQETITVNNKDFLLEYLQQTTSALSESVAGLNETQLQFKPAEGGWSISQVLEHIVATEQMLLNNAIETLEKPANPERKEEIQTTDEELIRVMTDRSEKFDAPEMLQGEGKYNDTETAISEFMQIRNRVTATVNETSLEDLRNHISDSPGGPIDAYQSFLFIAGHTARHTLQMEEVKAAQGFPVN